jgi:hypothetical protein
MAASDATVAQVLVVIERHVDRKTLRAIVQDLLEVPGNQSFRDTISKLARGLRVRVDA